MALNGEPEKIRAHAGHKTRERVRAVGKKSASPSISVNPIKSKIRDVTRLLEHSEHLPAGVRIDKERELAGYKHDLELAESTKKRQQMIKKYHMVRFFERKRATKNLKRLRAHRALANIAESMPEEQLRKELHDAEVDVNYTMYHPLAEKYLSLFPRDEAIETAVRRRSTTATKPPMWKIVEACMESGTLQDLRDGKLRSQYAETASERGAKRSGANKSLSVGKNVTTQVEPERDLDDDSDGGFFER